MTCDVEPKQNEWHSNAGILIFSPDQKLEVMLSNGSMHIGYEYYFLWDLHPTLPHVVTYRIIEPVAESFEGRVRISPADEPTESGFKVRPSSIIANATLSGQTLDGKPTGTWTLECDD